MRKWLALAIQVPVLAMVWAGCNGGDDTADAGDAALDVKAEKKPIDVNVPEEPLGCVPSNVSSSDLTWTPPAAANATACSDQQISDYYADCLNPNAPTGACTTWQGITANANCAKCLVTQESASAWGPLIAVPNNVLYANIGGCIALETGDTTSSGCGAKAWQASQCEDLSCSNNCAGSAFTDYQACTQAAATGTCAPEIAAECDLSDAGAIYATCVNHQDFQSYFLAIAPVFCGGYSADAGAGDAGSDASTDAATDAPSDAMDDASDATTD